MEHVFALIILVVVFMCKPKRVRTKKNHLELYRKIYKARKFEEVENN